MSLRRFRILMSPWRSRCRAMTRHLSDHSTGERHSRRSKVCGSLDTRAPRTWIHFGHYLPAIHAIERTCLLGMRISRRFLRRSEWRPFPTFLNSSSAIHRSLISTPLQLELLGDVVDVEYHRAGQIIFSQGEDPVEFLRVIRTGSVEVVSDGQVLDLLEMGEMFGHASMLSGLPTGFEARAAEDTLTYRFPAATASQILAGPGALRYVTRLILEDRHHCVRVHRAKQPGTIFANTVRDAIRSAPTICPPSTTIREAAQLMTANGASALIVDLGSSIGIVTNSDLRSRVVAEGLSGDEPVSSVMTAPAFTVTAERPGSEVLLDMLGSGSQALSRHFGIRTGSGHCRGP